MGVEAVRDLRLFEPEIPVGDELLVRQAAQVEILLAQELVARLAHGSPPGPGANGRVPSAAQSHLGAATNLAPPAASSLAAARAAVHEAWANPQPAAVSSCGGSEESHGAREPAGLAVDAEQTSGFADTQVAADLPRQEVVDLAMSRHR